MILPLYIHYPSWIHPELFPGVPVLSLLRWYGLMYICAFGTAFFILKKLLKEGFLDSRNSDGSLRKATEDEIFSFIATGIVFLLIGARVFSTLVYNQYDPSNPDSINYWTHPWLIFWPFHNGSFTGLAGMSYHGGFLGGLFGIIFWCRRNKVSFLKWADSMAVAIPLGYTFGRIGNFMNGELYGRITTVPWGMVFPSSEKFSASIPWVNEFLQAIGLDISTGLVQLPRHPSQLYEAIFEGLVLFLIIWFLHKKKPFDGFLVSIYTAGYGLFRFIIEYFRTPDADIGYVLCLNPFTINKEILRKVSVDIFISPAYISKGQIFCFLMFLGGVTLAVISWRLNKKNAQNI